MLKKLLKYDLENKFKVLGIFYVISISFAIITRVLLSVDNSLIINIIGKISSGITISMIFNILINNIMRIWVRFKQNLYGDEAYLTHTLPVDRRTIYLSKFLNSIITIIISTLVIGVTLFIAYYSKENINLVKTLLLPLVNIYDTSMINFLLIILLVFALELMSIIQSGYTGLILGHRKNNYKTLWSIVFGFITYTITQLVVLIFLFAIAIFNPTVMKLFTTNTINDLNIFKFLLIFCIFVYILCVIINYFINTKLFEKGVNVD